MFVRCFFCENTSLEVMNASYNFTNPNHRFMSMKLQTRVNYFTPYQLLAVMHLQEHVEVAPTSFY